MLKVKATALATICLSIIGCGGGGSSDPETDNNNSSGNNTTVLTGVFVDSAVEGATYATATQSGTTNEQGQFNYIAGEEVIFSIGATQLPTVTAAAQVSPVDMAAGTADPSATTTNIARLLQSLDDDGNPDNGITIPASAAATAATINFNVSVTDFENDPAVINLVANSGSTTTALISAEAADQHLNDTLGTGGVNTDATIGTFAGFYDSTMNSDYQHYLLINTDGSAIEYENRDENVETCYDTEVFTFVPLGGNQFRLERDGRDAIEFSVSIQNGGLLLSNEAESILWPQVTSRTATDLTICS